MNIGREIQRVATIMHNEYEECSKILNWKTQKSCNNKKFKDLPIKNQNVMKYLARKMLIREKKKQIETLKQISIPPYDDSYAGYKKREIILNYLKKEIKELNKWKHIK